MISGKLVNFLINWAAIVDAAQKRCPVLVSYTFLCLRSKQQTRYLSIFSGSFHFRQKAFTIIC